MGISSVKMYEAMCRVYYNSHPGTSVLSPRFLAVYLPDYWATFQEALVRGVSILSGNPRQLHHLILIAECDSLSRVEESYILYGWRLYQDGLSCRSVLMHGEVRE